MFYWINAVDSDSDFFQRGRPLVLARIQGLDPNLAKTALSDFEIESVISNAPAGEVVDLFVGQGEPSTMNFVLRLADFSGASQRQNVTFRLIIPDNNGGGSPASVVPFGFLYVPDVDRSVRSIHSISVTQGSILGGTAVVVMLR